MRLQRDAAKRRAPEACRWAEQRGDRMKITETNGVAVLSHNGHSIELSPSQIRTMAEVDISQLRQLLRDMRIPVESDVNVTAKNRVNDAIREMQQHVYKIPRAIKHFLETRNLEDDGASK